MTATIHPHPRSRLRRPDAGPVGAGYPAAFGSAAGPGFLTGVCVRPHQPVRPAPLAETLAAMALRLSRPWPQAS